MRVLLTGSQGLLGTYLSSTLRSSVELIAPTRDAFDLTKPKQIAAFLRQSRPDVVIHTGAFTDNTQAEKERGDKEGACWQVNVEGTRSVAQGAKEIGAYMVFISTGSVFSCQMHEVNHFCETDAPSSEDALSWYGYTKAIAETYVEGAIVRLSHVVGASKKDDTHKDYLEHLLDLYDRDALYPLFTDQYFPITSASHVTRVLKTLMVSKSVGVFHVATNDVCSPYELFIYALRKKGMNAANIPTISWDEFIKTTSFPKRYAKRICLQSDLTQESLRIASSSWKNVIDEIVSSEKSG